MRPLSASEGRVRIAESSTRPPAAANPGVSSAFIGLLSGLAQPASSAPARATAPDADALGGLTPEDFFEVTGEVVSGGATITAINTLTPLLTLPGAAITVSVSASAELIELVIHNGTAQDLPAVREDAAPAGGGTAAIELTAGRATKLPLGPASAANSLHMQIFSSGALTEVVTMIVSSEEAANRGPVSIVGQAFMGVG